MKSILTRKTSGVQDISGKEDKTNKVSSFQATPDDTHYPTEKLVKDSLNAKITGIYDSILKFFILE
jgi:hypothetical protein